MTTFLKGTPIDIVAKFDKDENEKGGSNSELILIHIGTDNETRKLYELGDGIQAIIILMYKIFMAEDRSFIYIDEPELHLHPGMQRLFLEQISSNKVLIDKNLTFFITTHSNHFLDLTIEQDCVSIYAFSPKGNETGDKQFVINNVNGGYNQTLKHLGVNNSSVFMANCSIWVEGISDRNYIKAFLKSYSQYLQETESDKYKSIKEDIDYAFFEYAGSNIEHYIFGDNNNQDENDMVVKDINALALSNRIFLLADSDNENKTTRKGKRLKILEDSKSENFYPKIIWEVREIENLLTDKVWEKVLINFCNKNLIDDDRSGIQDKISNAVNSINQNDFRKDYIGEYLNCINIKLGKIGKANILNKVYEDRGESFGTFILKRELSELVLKADLDWEIYKENPLIENITKEIYQFIKKVINKKALPDWKGFFIFSKIHTLTGNISLKML